MRGVPAAFMGVFLAACAGQTPPPEAPVVPKPYGVPTPVPCAAVERLGPEPDYPDTDALLAAVPHPGAETRLMANAQDAEARTQVAENLYYRVQHVLAGRLKRIDRDAQKTAALSACSKLPPAQPPA